MRKQVFPLTLSLVLGLAIASSAYADEPTVLHFAPGAIKLTTRGTLSRTIYKHRYSLDVQKGQTLTFDFEGDGPLVGTIDCGGTSDGPFGGAGDKFVVPRTGPCIVTMLISPMAERWDGSYKLSITAK